MAAALDPFRRVAPGT
jgi:hypothetical protein